MADKHGFSATKFIKKQYNKDEVPPTEKSVPTNDVASPEVSGALTAENIKLLIKQYLESAESHSKEGRVWEAIGVYKAGIQLAPQDLTLLQKLADSYLKANARAESVDILTKIAAIYERQGNMDIANNIYEKIYGLDPANDLACSVLGRRPEHHTPHLDLFAGQPEAEEKLKQPALDETVADNSIISEPVIISLKSSQAISIQTVPLDETQVTTKLESPLPEKMTGPEPVKEILPLDKMMSKIEMPMPPVKTKPVSEDEIPTVIKRDTAPAINVEGPKPVEELMPLDKIVESQKQEFIPPTPVESTVTAKIAEKVEPKSVEELIPFPPMPEKKVETPKPVTVSQNPVIENHLEPEDIKEEFPMPLPEMRVDVGKPIEMPMPKPKPSELKVETPEPVATSPSPPESSEDKVQYYLDILATDPENIEARLNYINAYLEIGLEMELVDDYIELANCYHDQGQIEFAKKYYNKVLQIDPNIEMAKRRLAIYKGELPPGTGQGEVIVQPSSAPVATPTGPSGELNNADMQQVSQFKRLLQINPLNEQIARKLASFYRSKNMKNEAVSELGLLADAYMQRGMYAKATPIYEDILKESPNEDTKQKLVKAKGLVKSMDAINQAIQSYKTDLNVPTRKTP